MRAAWRMAALGALLLAAGAALAGGAHAYATPGTSGAITLDSMGAPPSALWKVSATTYQLNESLIVSAGDTLQLPAGTQLNFTNSTELIVLGGLEVRGTAASPVRLGVVPDAMSMAVAWGGVRAQGASSFVLENAVFSDTIDIAYSNATGARLTNVTYQGRLLFDNASDLVASGLVMTITPTDVGRISLWIESSSDVAVSNADFVGGTGWGGAAVIIENSSDITVRDLVLRVDSPNLIGVLIPDSLRVALYNFTFRAGPMGGDPNQALEIDNSEAVLVDGLAITQVPVAGVGAIYGVGSNATISNSTFDPGLVEGVWSQGGTLTSVNATRLPVRPLSGATIREFELVRVEVRWQAGGSVASGTASITNASWSASSPVASGSTGWMWALRSTNATGNLTDTRAYRASVTCNCTPDEAFFNLTDSPGVTIVLIVGDASPPTPAASAPGARTGTPITLDGTASTDNAGVAAYQWSVLGALPVNGLPCAAATCEVTFDAPGTYTIQLNVTDTSGLQDFTRIAVVVADVTRPVVAITTINPPRPGQDEPFQITATAQDNDPGFLPAVEWYLDGNRTTGDTLVLTLQVAALGDHTVRLVVRDDGGNEAEANTTFEVRDSRPPEIAVFNLATDLIAPAKVTLNGSAATDNLAVTAWTWQVTGPGTNYTLTGRAPNATFPAAGTYNITLTAEDAEGNRASRTAQVLVVSSQQAPSDGGLPLLLLVGLGSAAAVLVASVLLRPAKGTRKPDGADTPGDAPEPRKAATDEE